MEIVRTTLFSKAALKLGASGDELAQLEAEIAANPKAGKVIPALRGVLKLWFKMKGKGKSGGGRCIYLVLTINDTVYLLLAYDKSVQSDLSAAQRKVILALVEELT